MGKVSADIYTDNGPQYLKDNCVKMVICEGEPADYTDANTAKGSGGHKIGEHTMVTGDFTVTNGDTNGRKVVIAAQNDINIDVAGDADHVALLSGSVMLMVTTISPAKTGLAVNDKVNVPEFDDEFADPA